MSTESEWRYVIRLVEEGRAPPAAQLRRLVRGGPIPEDAREYVASRIGKGPGIRTSPDPIDFVRYGPFTEKQGNVLADLILLDLFLPDLGSSEPPPKHGDTERKRTIRFEAAPERQVPERQAEVRLKWVESRQVWKVKEPKEQAREIVAGWHGAKTEAVRERQREFWKHVDATRSEMSPAEKEEWERDLLEWERELETPPVE